MRKCEGTIARRKNESIQARKAMAETATEPSVPVGYESSFEEEEDEFSDGSTTDELSEGYLSTTQKADSKPIDKNERFTTTARFNPIATDNTIAPLSPSSIPKISSSLPASAQSTYPMITQAMKTQVTPAVKTTTIEGNTTVSQPHVPNSKMNSLKELMSEIEEFRVQVKKLVFDLNKKDRDLKSAKNEASTLRAKQSILRQAQSEEWRKLELELKLKHEAECKALKRELENIQGEREKNAADLRELRAKHKELKGKHREVQKNLANLTESSAQQARRIEELTHWRDVSDETTIKLESDLAAANTDNQRLRAQLLEEQSKEMTLGTQYNKLILGSANLFARNIECPSMTVYFNNSPVYSSANCWNYRGYDEGVENELGHEKRGNTRILAKTNSSISQPNRVPSGTESISTELIALQSENQKQEERIAELLARVTDLEIDKDWKSPLVKLAVDIRLRYLENAREAVEGASKFEIDRAIISSGNNAAHRANVTVDAALFYLGMVPDTYVQEGTHIFEKLYGVHPDDYCNWSRQKARLIDCRATLLAIKLADGIGSLRKRLEHDELDAKLEHLSDVLCIEEFEVDYEVEVKLSRLEKINDKIVEADRVK